MYIASGENMDGWICKRQREKERRIADLSESICINIPESTTSVGSPGVLYYTRRTPFESTLAHIPPIAPSPAANRNATQRHNEEVYFSSVVPIGFLRIAYTLLGAQTLAGPRSDRHLRADQNRRATEEKSFRRRAGCADGRSRRLPRG
jgi:hypothetical protein